MRKYIIIVVLCLIMCGCGCNKKTKEENKIDSDINDVTYKLSVTCLDKTVESALFLGKDKTFTYDFYECSGDSLHLKTGYGNYKIKGDTIILTDNYDQKWNVSLNKGKVEVELNGNILTLTK